MIVPVGGDPPSPEALARAVEALAQGRPIGLPTDTVYGLAADPFLPGATDRIFEMKRRPRDVNLPVLVSGTDQALALATAVPGSRPGAHGPVLARAPSPSSSPPGPGLAADLGDDDATIGVRCPDHPVPLALCPAVGPLATTSANRHGEPTLTTAAEVAAVFGDALPVVLDGGTCAGSPSTVVDCTGVEPKLLREGRVPWSAVLAALDG